MTVFLVNLAISSDATFNEDVSRCHFTASLTQIKDQVYQERYPLIQAHYNRHHASKIFISYAFEPDIKDFIEQKLSPDLERLGLQVLYAQRNIGVGDEINNFEKKASTETFILMLCTPRYLQRYNDHGTYESTGVGREVKRILERLEYEKNNDEIKGKVLPLYRKGSFNECIPPQLSNTEAHRLAAFDLNDTQYHRSLFDLAQTIFLYDDLEHEPIKTIRDQFFQLLLNQNMRVNTITSEREGVIDDPYFDERQQKKQQKQQRKFDKLLEKARKPHKAYAQHKLYQLYKSQQVIFADTNNLLRWCHKARTQNFFIDVIIGWMYQDNRGVQVNNNNESDREAVRLFQNATTFQGSKTRGYAAAHYHLGLMYEQGHGVQLSPKKAITCYYQAAEQDYPQAFDKIVKIYTIKGERTFINSKIVQALESNCPNQALQMMPTIQFSYQVNFRLDHVHHLFPYLTKLLLTSSYLDTIKIKPIISLNTLTSLDISCNQVGDAGAKDISTMSNLTSLGISSNQVGDTGVRNLSTMSNLTSLGISSNQVGDTGVRNLSTMSNLTSLDISNNQLYNAGAKDISTMSNLTSLDMYDNQVGDAGARDISTMFNLRLLNYIQKSG